MCEDNEGLGRIRRRYPLIYHRIKCYFYMEYNVEFCAMKETQVIKETRVWI